MTNPKLLCKAILICEGFGLTERDAQGFIEVFGSSIKIKKLDDRVIGNAYSRPEVAYILKQIFYRNKDSDGILSGDGTGLETSRRQNYGDNKTSQKNFLLLSLIQERLFRLLIFLEKMNAKQCIH